MRVLHARQAKLQRAGESSADLRLPRRPGAGVCCFSAGPGARLGLSRTGFLFGSAAVALWTLWHCRAPRPARPPDFRGVLVVAFLAAGLYLRPAHRLGRARPVRRRVIFATTTPAAPGGDPLEGRHPPLHQRQPAVLQPWRTPLPRGPGPLARLPWARSVLVLGAATAWRCARVLRHRHVEPDHPGGSGPGHDRAVHPQRGAGRPQRRVAVRPAGHGGERRAAGQWLEEHGEVFDLIIADFPDPSSFGLGKLYSVPVCRLTPPSKRRPGEIAIHLALVRPRSCWCILTQPCGRRRLPYPPTTPRASAFGEWGFNLATRRPGFTPHHLQRATRCWTPTPPG